MPAAKGMIDEMEETRESGEKPKGTAPVFPDARPSAVVALLLAMSPGGRRGEGDARPTTTIRTLALPWEEQDREGKALQEEREAGVVNELAMLRWS